MAARIICVSMGRGSDHVPHSVRKRPNSFNLGGRRLPSRLHAHSNTRAHTHTHTTADHALCLHTSIQYNHNSPVFVDLTSFSAGGWGWSCYLSARPRLPTRPSLRVSPFCCDAKLCEGKSTSISHAFLRRRGRESTPLSFDEQGFGCVILE